MSKLGQAIAGVLPASQIISDPLRRLAYGSDASFYRMTPELVLWVESEAQVQALLQVALAHGRGVTFRAAGTSLSGQAVTDGLLVLSGEGFARCEIAADAATVRMGPAMIGGEVRWDWPLYHKLAKIVKSAAADEKVPLQWGGDWRAFKDGPHWELPWKFYPKGK